MAAAARILRVDLVMPVTSGGAPLARGKAFLRRLSGAGA